MQKSRQCIPCLRTTIVRALSVAALGAAGCATPGSGGTDAASKRALSLLMPSRIEIVEPFTRVKSFDGNPSPDGIEVLIQAINALDNPGLMIVGRLRIELYEFVSASADPRGQKVEHWDIELTSVEQQKAFWNRLTQMYELKLVINPSQIRPAARYVLTALYSTPLGESLTDECVLDAKALASAIGHPTSYP